MKNPFKNGLKKKTKIIEVNSITFKVVIAFSSMIVIFLLVLFMIISMVNNLNKNINSLTKYHECSKILKDMEMAVTTEQNFQSLSLNAGKLLLSASQYSTANDQFKATYDTFSKYSNLVSEEEKNYMKNLAKLNEDYYNLFFNEILPNSNDIINGAGISLEADQKRIDNSKKLKEMDDKLEKSFNNLNNLFKSKINNYVILMQKQISMMLIYFVSAIVIAIFLTILFSFLLSKSIISRINHINAAARNVGEGDLTVNFDVGFKDEFGILAKIFDNTIKNIRKVIYEIYSASETISSVSEEAYACNDQNMKDFEGTLKQIENITKSATDQQERISGIYSSTSHVSKSVEEISGSVNILDKYINETYELGSSMLANFRNATHQMSNINNEIHQTKDLVESLMSKSKNIESIADIIQHIATQTNLLSLNAAIEASKAGENGKSFGVVASEIKKLSLQVEESSKSIISLVKTINEETAVMSDKITTNTMESEKGILLVSETGDAFNNILNSLNQQLNTINTLSESTNRLTNNFHKISNNIKEIQESSEYIVNSTETSADSIYKQHQSAKEMLEAATSLAEIAAKLNELIGVFKI